MSSLEKVSGANVVLSAVAVSVIELTVAPTLAAFCTSIVMSTEKANDPEPDWLGHCGLHRVAVIGLGRTATLTVAVLEPGKPESDGAVVPLLHAIDAIRATAVIPAHSVLFTVSPRAAHRRGATACAKSSIRFVDNGRMCEVDASDIRARFFTTPQGLEPVPPAWHHGVDMRITFAAKGADTLNGRTRRRLNRPHVTRWFARLRNRYRRFHPPLSAPTEHPPTGKALRSRSATLTVIVAGVGWKSIRTHFRDSQDEGTVQFVPQAAHLRAACMKFSSEAHLRARARCLIPNAGET